MKRMREEDEASWADPGFVKQPRLFSDLQPSNFLRPLPVRINSEPFPLSSGYRAAADNGISDGSTDGSPQSAGSPTDMPDIDMDDEFSIVGSVSPPIPSPPSNRPAKLMSSSLGRAGTPLHGRIPTPTTHGFAQNAPTPARTSSFNILDGTRVHSPLAPPLSRRFGPARDYPMPSPIRESVYSPSRESMPSPSVSPRTMSIPMASAMESPAAAVHDMSRLSVNGDGMDIEERPMESPTAVRMGRQRSGALFTEKKRFHLGYLDDCEKCRARVPGHHSHFLPVET